ncbi:Calcium/calmodulin-dependent protein kinase type I [Tieghemiomyces parasiticus]|uniref:Calcium/calmodulin-dependent protein kinase type I n=1 Tax=Tieghemiomyces parasiticus TaxID=78921 RepID=A0A9W8AJI9_9FUNG|nr:Calcium/calmodulin-dependent protein kinase type I [Tieghemiomyces parasiticus]
MDPPPSIATSDSPHSDQSSMSSSPASPTSPLATQPEAVTTPCRYRSGHIIGSGTFSVVKEVYRIDTGERLAAKVIPKRLVRGKERLLQNEVTIMRKLSHVHPNLLTLHDCFETANNIYLVTELATGGDLFDRLSSKGTFYETEAAIIIRSVVRAVAFLHSQNIVHRGGDADLMIADFGLSTIVTESDATDLSARCGTAGYMAPEILLRQTYGPPVDMWAVGVMTYLLLSGFMPFEYARASGSEDDGHAGGDFHPGQLSEAELINDLFTYSYDYLFEPAQYWRGITYEARDFIKSLINTDPERRMTAEMALAHPWLTDERLDLIVANKAHAGAVSTQLAAKKIPTTITSQPSSNISTTKPVPTATKAPVLAPASTKPRPSLLRNIMASIASVARPRQDSSSVAPMVGSSSDPSSGQLAPPATAHSFPSSPLVATRDEATPSSVAVSVTPPSTPSPRAQPQSPPPTPKETVDQMIRLLYPDTALRIPDTQLLRVAPRKRSSSHEKYQEIWSRYSSTSSGEDSTRDHSASPHEAIALPLAPTRHRRTGSAMPTSAFSRRRNEGQIPSDATATPTGRSAPHGPAVSLKPLLVTHDHIPNSLFRGGHDRSPMTKAAPAATALTAAVVAVDPPSRSNSPAPSLAGSCWESRESFASVAASSTESLVRHRAGRSTVKIAPWLLPRRNPGSFLKVHGAPLEAAGAQEESIQAAGHMPRQATSTRHTGIQAPPPSPVQAAESEAYRHLPQLATLAGTSSPHTLSPVAFFAATGRSCPASITKSLRVRNPRDFSAIPATALHTPPPSDASATPSHLSLRTVSTTSTADRQHALMPSTQPSSTLPKVVITTSSEPTDPSRISHQPELHPSYATHHCYRMSNSLNLTPTTTTTAPPPASAVAEGPEASKQLAPPQLLDLRPRVFNPRQTFRKAIEVVRLCIALAHAVDHHRLVDERTEHQPVRSLFLAPPQPL